MFPPRGATGTRPWAGHSSRNLQGTPMGKFDPPAPLPASIGVSASAQGVTLQLSHFVSWKKRKKIANIAALRQLPL